jgi:hypothetical protein
MSEEIEATLVTRMLDSMGEFRKCIAAQREMIQNQQEILAGVSAMLERHTSALQMHQRTIEVMAAQLGIAFDPLPEPPHNPPIVN